MLTCDQRIHDDVRSFGLHHRGLVHAVGGRWLGRGRGGDTGLPFLRLFKRGKEALEQGRGLAQPNSLLWGRSHCDTFHLIREEISEGGLVVSTQLHRYYPW